MWSLHPSCCPCALVQYGLRAQVILPWVWDGTLLGVLAGACPQERSSERGCKNNEVLCRKSVALDLAEALIFNLLHFRKFAVWMPVGPWVSSLGLITWEALVGLWDQLGSVCGGSQGGCGDLLGIRQALPWEGCVPSCFPKCIL